MRVLLTLLEPTVHSKVPAVLMPHARIQDAYVRGEIDIAELGYRVRSRYNLA
ncbi:MULTISPECIES: hypothetical protein [unclassified Rhodococcus (in: high G+C Gram-positive bacteria)]|uniref:hypothetical protein n=1 Tax=unclassified Rhodococcus (in: high G+C Gram-positive bacteria) TaxID=192944 RepID=UPI001FF9B665|nr:MULTISPECIES: hypothetical protein [unclassified Rhodococcus (in: high G+C Gram-positive bacteria)]